MWDLPRPGLEPVSPALAGRLPTTAPPGKPDSYSLEVIFVGYYMIISINNTMFKKTLFNFTMNY